MQADLEEGMRAIGFIVDAGQKWTRTWTPALRPLTTRPNAPLPSSQSVPLGRFTILDQGIVLAGPQCITRGHAAAIACQRWPFQHVAATALQGKLVAMLDCTLQRS